MWDGSDSELKNGQAHHTNQKASQRKHLRQTVRSETSTVPVKDTLASVSDLQPNHLNKNTVGEHQLKY